MSQPALPRETPDIESSSEDYASRFAGPVGKWFLEVQSRLTLELLSPWPGARVLEVGGGHAQLAGPLTRAGYQVTVTGSHPSCAARLARQLPAEALRFVTCDLTRLPFADRSFEVVTAYRMLAHLERWPEFLAELCRVASQAVLVDYPETRSFNIIAERLFAAKLAVEKNTRQYKCFHGKQLRAVLAGQGCGGFTTRPQFFWPMAVHRGLGRAGLSRGMEGLAGALGLRSLLGSPVLLLARREG